LGEIVDYLTCPECGSPDFLQGARGGLAINVKCEKCGYRMNIAILPKGKFWIIQKFGK